MQSRDHLRPTYLYKFKEQIHCQLNEEILDLIATNNYCRWSLI